MKYIISPDVFEKFPRYVRGVVIARSINNRAEHEELVVLLNEVAAAATQDESLQTIKAHPRIAPWRQAYADFGSNPNKFYSSIESLGRRARRGDQIPYINTLVALFNYFSLKHTVPSGGDDLETVDGDLLLRLAKGDEPFTPFNAEEVEYPDAGEVIYVDSSRVMCRRWNWRQGYQTRLTPETSNVAINVDCLPPVLREEAETITGELAELVRKFCGGEVRHFMLDAANNEVQL
ncbi:B3/4 domain-containing protein [Chloroflexota bacterium]